MRKSWLLLLAGPLLLMACNTTQGVGRDLQSAGDTVEKAATPKD